MSAAVFRLATYPLGNQLMAQPRIILPMLSTVRAPKQLS
jgi:hypothetical protein